MLIAFDGDYVARALGATVKAHIGRLYTKLEVTNRVRNAICVLDTGPV